MLLRPRRRRLGSARGRAVAQRRALRPARRAPFSSPAARAAWAWCWARSLAARARASPSAPATPDDLERARGDLRTAEAHGCSPLTCDVTRARARSERRVREVTRAARGRSTSLMNNAGMIEVGPVEHHGRSSDFERGDATSTSGAPLHAILAVLPAMRARGAGPHREHRVDRRQGRRAAPACRTARASSRWSGCPKACERAGQDGVLVTTVAPAHAHRAASASRRLTRLGALATLRRPRRPRATASQGDEPWNRPR